MAEKYGTIPKRWTKDWWHYFWDYYKWYVVGTIFVVMIIVITAVQCAHSEKYDQTVTYAGYSQIAEDGKNKVMDALDPLTSDIDGNGKQRVLFQALSLTKENEDAQYNYAIQTKFQLEFTNEFSFVMIIDKSMLDEMLTSETYSDVFIPVSDWAETTPADDLLEKNGDTAYGIKVSDSKILKDAGITLSDSYVVVRNNSKDEAKNKQAFADAKKIANALVKSD